ncbi:hypothetical protein AADZ86_10555 [Colwelliaceae bacterium BS250]
MAVTEQQFNYLNTMGISLWQPRTGFYKDKSVQPTDVKNTINKISTTAHSPQSTCEVISATPSTPIIQVKPMFSAEELVDNVLLQDILLILDTNLGAISATAAALKLADLCWQFHDNDECSLQHKQLLTPRLDRIAANHTIKQQLWALLCENQQQLTLNSDITNSASTVEIK